MSSIEIDEKRVGVRKSLRRQRGQALPLGALGLLIMSLAIIATMNLGQAVHEKIKLQNSADAAAYSLAAMEARAIATQARRKIARCKNVRKDLGKKKGSGVVS